MASPVQILTVRISKHKSLHFLRENHGFTFGLSVSETGTVMRRTKILLTQEQAAQVAAFLANVDDGTVLFMENHLLIELSPSRILNFSKLGQPTAAFSISFAEHDIDITPEQGMQVAKFLAGVDQATKA